MIDAIISALSSGAWIFLFPFLGLLRWDEFYEQNLNNGGGDFWSQFGVSNPGTAGGLMPNMAQWTTLNQSAGFDNGNPLLTASGTAGNRTYSFGDRQGATFGAGGGGGGGSAPSGGGLQPQPVQQLPVNSQLSGANLGLQQVGGLTPQTIGTLPVGSQLANVTPIAGAGAGAAPAYTVTAGAAATPVTSTSSWWGKMMGNKKLMSSLITGAASVWNQYQQKGAQKDMYRAQERELAAQRAYQEEMYQRRQNSPQAQVARALLPAVLQFYSQRLGRRGVNLPLDGLLQSILGGNGGGQ